MSPRLPAGTTVQQPVRLVATLTSGVLLLAVASGCASGAADPSASATESSRSSDSSSSGAGASLTVGDAVEPGQALIVSASNVDGPTTQRASALVNDQAVETFVSDTDARLADEVRTAVKAVQVPDGSTLFGSVVSVGCDKPVAVTWDKTFDGIEATAEVPKSGVQCLVPVTSVALFLVADSV